MRADAFQPGWVAKCLYSAVAGLLLVHVAFLFLRYQAGHDHVYGLAPLFYFDAEFTVPSFFSSCLFFACAALFLGIHRQGRKLGHGDYAWLLMAVIFAVLGFDELLSFHERLNAPTRELLSEYGSFYVAWVVPYGVAVIVIAIIFMPVFFRLSRALQKLFVLSATAYLVGAIGFEILGGLYKDYVNSERDIVYDALATFEETLEMIGLATLVYAQLSMIDRRRAGAE